MPDKVKVNLDPISYNRLIRDMEIFHITKTDKSPNKNLFINLLYKNMLDDYMEIVINQVKAMKNANIDEKKALSLFFKLENVRIDTLNKYFNTNITFILHKENEKSYKELLKDKFNGLSESSFFRNLIYAYLDKPQSKREEIIFKDNYNLILKAINNKQAISFIHHNNKVNLAPYKLATSKEEFLTYVIGLNANMKVRSYHLSTMNDLKIEDNFTTFDDEICQLFDRNISNGINYPYDKEYNVSIKMNDQAIRKFESNFINRPYPTKIDGNIYTFNCSFYQLKSYFSGFTKDIIVYGKRLKEALIDEYQDAINSYNE